MRPGKKRTIGRSAKGPSPVEAIRHKDTRVNIPTRELRDFVKDGEAAPKTLLYPRDASLAPQLVWKGKDEQDRQDLAVPVVPIYIQEKIHPQALVENLRDTAKKGEPEPELSLFADFNGIMEFDKKVDFYHHEGHWSNRLILGDYLLVMSSLAEKEGLKGKVQCIYFDPPYGIKFGSNWQVSTRKQEVKDGRPADVTRQPEQIRAYRDTWERGIHSYLSYLRDRLSVARELLTETGSVFVQIGDQNAHLVRSILDELFGSENHVSTISIRKLAGVESTLLPATTDFVLFYAKDLSRVKYRQLFSEKTDESTAAERYDQVRLAGGAVRAMTALEKNGQEPLPPNARRFQLDNVTSDEFRPDTTVEIEAFSKRYHPGSTLHWKTSVDGMKRLQWAGRLAETGQGKLRYVRLLEDFPASPLGNLWYDISGAVQSRSDPKIYVVQTSTALV